MSLDIAWGWLLYLVDLLIKIVALGIVPRNRRPASGQVASCSALRVSSEVVSQR